MKTYRFTKAYEDYKVGDTAEIDAELAEVLVKTGTVELVDLEADAAYAKQLKSIETVVAKQIEKAVSAMPKDDHPNINVMVEVVQAEEDKGFESLGSQLKAVMNASKGTGQMDPRLKAAASGQNETVGAEGGFLVQDQFSSEMIKRAFGESVLAPRCSNITLGANANSLSWNERSDYDEQDANRNIQVYWTDEAATMTAATAKFARQQMTLEKLTGLYYATDESLQDAQSLEMLVDEWFNEEFSFKLDQAILRGDGVGKPLGVYNSDADIAQAKESGQTADTVNATNIAKMYARMDASCLAGAEWYINQEVFPQLIVATLGDIPIWTPPASGISGAPGGLLLGKPLNFLDHCSTLGDVGDIMFANMSKYRLITKGGLSKDASIHVRFLFNETAFRFTMRINGQPVWSNTVTPSQATTHTRSPFITLAARA